MTTTNPRKGRVGTTGPTGDSSVVIDGAGSPSPEGGRPGSPSPEDGRRGSPSPEDGRPGSPSPEDGRAGSPSPEDGRAGSPSPADGKCRQRLLELSAYLEGDLTPERMEALDAHLAQCTCCETMAASLRRAIDLCRSDEARHLPADVQARALSRVRALLAAADD